MRIFDIAQTALLTCTVCIHIQNIAFCFGAGKSKFALLVLFTNPLPRTAGDVMRYGAPVRPNRGAQPVTSAG